LRKTINIGGPKFTELHGEHLCESLYYLYVFVVKKQVKKSGETKFSAK
jgi:hypothetical protein